MRSPRATSTDAPTTRSCAITRWTIASRSAALRSAEVADLACNALAAEQRSNMAIAERAGFEMVKARMAGDYRHERCQLLSIKANPATDDTDSQFKPLKLNSFDQCKSVLSASSAVRFDVCASRC